MMMKEKLLELDSLLSEGLKRHGYVRKKKYTYQRKIDQGVQEISFVSTKTRGKEEAHINIFAGFNYPELNEIVYFIRDEQYDRAMYTTYINIATIINPKKTYGFYINQSTDVKSVAEDILMNIKKYVLLFLDKCNTLEKYESMLLSKEEIVRRSTLKPPEWNLLALSLFFGRKTYNDLIKEYYNDFAKNMPLLQRAQEQIEKFDRRIID